MLKEMKEKVQNSLKDAKERGELSTHRIYDTTRESVADVAQSVRSEASELREVTKEIVTTTVSNARGCGRSQPGADFGGFARCHRRNEAGRITGDGDDS